ncbi:dTDP-glucose 4,6-dehydratase [Rhizobiales bacterium GAS191]|jgi:dTDP-glucose 4,6-dehydratase|nr:dTDP-glucose 4,6-dehydratase [Rhizobiales bacterium GAS191]
MKTVLVTGGAGFIGGHVVRELVASERYRVVNVDALTYAADHRLLEPLRMTGRYLFEKVDIRDGAAVKALYDRYSPDGVMHLAAESHVDRSIENPLVFVETNVLGTANLLVGALAHSATLEPARRAEFRFLHVSTDEVFGSLGLEGAFHEKTAYDPSSPYSASKASSDHMVRAWGRTYGLPVLITNCSNNYGPGQFPEKLIPLMILKAWRGEPLPVYGKGENVRDWLHVVDHARALQAVFERGTPGETYCVGGRSEKRNIDIVHAICDGLDAKLGQLACGPRRKLIAFVADRPGHDQRYAIDASRIEAELGWRPAMSIEAGLQDTIDWYLANEPWWAPLVARQNSLDRRGLDVKPG